MTATHIIRWNEYAETRIQYEQMKEASDNAYKAMKIAEAKLIDTMLEDEVTGIPDACGANAHLKTNFNIRLNQENSEAVEQWLRDTVGDAEVFKKTALDKPAVTEHVKKLCGDGTPVEELPEFLGVSTRPTIAVRGWVKKKEELAK